MNRDYLKLAVSSLLHRKLRSWLTMIGIFIGIAAVISLIGLGEGMRYAINSQFGFLGTDIISVTASGGFGPPGSGVINPLTNKELDKVKETIGIEGAAGRLLESTKLKFNKKLVFGYAVSMPDGEERKIIEKAMNIKVQKGRTLKDSDSGVIVLGAGFLKEETFGKPVSTGAKIQVQDREFTVIGILEKKGSFQVDNAVIMNEHDMRSLFSLPKNEYDLISAVIKPNSDVNRIKADIERSLRKLRNVKEGEEDFQVQTPASILAQVNSVLIGVQIFVYIIAAISILVGGIGIMNTMYTAVVERTKEIGIMKSIGAKNSTIFALFFIESGLLGAVGGIVGIIGGILGSEALAFLGRIALGSDMISVKISYALIFGALLFSFILGSFFGTLPAIRASRLNPVDALRFAK